MEDNLLETSLSQWEQDSFRYQHPFYFIIELVKVVRRLKADAGLGNGRVKSISIDVRDNYWKIAMVLRSIDDLKFMCKCDEIRVYLTDTENPSYCFGLIA